MLQRLLLVSKLPISIVFVFTTAIPFVFIWIAVHELSHILAIKLYGGDVIEMVLYPHFREGGIFMGRVRYKPGGAPGKLVLVAPYIVDAVVFFLSYYLAKITQNSLWFTFLLCLAACPIVDTCVSMGGFLHPYKTDLVLLGNYAVIFALLNICYFWLYWKLLQRIDWEGSYG